MPLDKVIDINQAPIGRTPRSNPATYTGVFNDIRELYASTADAKMRGFSSGRFSFNVKGGRCEACQGDGIIKIEMHFLPDIYVPCEVCKGHRYNRETLEVKYKGKSIDDVLNMTVEEGVEFFGSIPKIARKLQTLLDVGLGYIKIGQPATTLSGGERSASSWPPSCPNGPRAVRFIFWMSPPPACTRRTFTSLSRCCRSWWTPATQLW